eukprot:TRINITY_DN64889_c0_g1_i1.p1 TRINITY_DN64889_c0_g1~~TRINITY_DN64889_c0_g1_i1.p1  ORF type:complete len:793 (+),score=253.16 TRINITY_DN64889_c0_g1_i1:75-2381(+)
MGKKGGAKKKQADTGAVDPDDALLAGYRAEQDKVHSAQVTRGVSVTPRANAAFCADSALGRLWLFGGECFSGESTTTYDDLLFWDIAAGEWCRVKPAGTRGPAARNGHQGVVVGGGLFVFGGEKTSKDGCDITHLSDLWRLDTQHMRWNETVSGQQAKLPSARSGHRMAPISEDSFVIFGGYHDTGHSRLKKFNDIYVASVAGESVSCRQAQPSGSKPAARSGCCLGGRGGMACVYGGVDAGNHPLADMWVVSPLEEKPVWREVSYEGGLGPRTGLSLAVPPSDGPALLFGGLTERRAEGAGRKQKETVFHNDLWQCDLAARRFARQEADDRGAGGRSRPRARMSAAVCACGGELFVYGGVLEVLKGQETLGDLWQRPLAEGPWKHLSGDAGRGMLGEDEDDESGDSDDVSEGVDDARSDDGLEFGYGIDAPLAVPRRLQGWTKGTVAQVNAWHYAMMNDAQRSAFYLKGLREACSDGAPQVIDVGAGAGLLSLLAVRAGAGNVVAVEARAELAGIAQENAARNGMADKVRVLPRVSTALQPVDLAPAPHAEVVVHELFGVLLLGERSLRFVADVRQRLGAPECAVVPALGVQYATLVSSPALDAVSGIDPGSAPAGLDLGHTDAVRDTCLVKATKELGIDLSHPAVGLTRLSERVPVAQVDYRSMSSEDVPLEREVEVPVLRDGRVSAVMLTWEAATAAGDRISTEPGEGGPGRSVAWGQGLQFVERGDDPGAALPRPLEVTAGSVLRMAVRFSQDLAQMQCEILPE